MSDFLWFLNPSHTCSDCGVSGERTTGRHELLLLSGSEGVYQGHQHPPALPAHQHAAGSPDGQSPERPHGHTKSKIQFYWIDRSYKQSSISYMFKTINYFNCNILSAFFFFSITTVLRTSVLEGDVCVMGMLRPVMPKIPTIHTSKWLLRISEVMCHKKL